MKQVQQSQIYLRKRKMMLVLPVLVIPFLTMAFWALGGGQSQQKLNTIKQAGMNLNLPDAGTKEDNMADKLSFYDKADKDSAKMEEWMRTDPYYQMKKDTIIPASNELELMVQNSAVKFNQRLNTSPYEVSGNSPEQKLIQKLALLEKEINKQPDAETSNSISAEPIADNEFNGEVNKLESMMQGMNSGNSEDPEIKQLGNTLDKILDIQHPQRVKDRLKEKSIKQKEVVFAVSKNYETDNISILDTGKKKMLRSAGFYGIENRLQDDENNISIEAVVNINQTLVEGSVIQLRLATDVFINGILIPKGNPVNGIVSLNNERLEAEINSIRYGNNLFPVKLEIYDMDGLAGIYVPGSISRDVSKQSADNTLQLLELTAVDPSLKAQAAAVGVNTIKNLMSRKVKQIKVMVKAGYKVLLKDKNINNL
ncbi:MAG: conjugative transposon protein TraM [Chitinophagaceae bacterium]